MILKYIPYFLLSAEQGSFSKAATRLYVTAPAVSKQVNALEEELGIALFDRTFRGVSLTPAGEIFYRDCKDLLNEFDAHVEELKKKFASHRCIRVGKSAMSAPLCSLLASAAEPEYAVDLVSVRPSDAVERLLENKIDLFWALGYDPSRHPNSPVAYLEIISCLPVCRIPPSLAAPKLTHTAVLSLEDIAPYTLHLLPRGSSDFDDKIYEEADMLNLTLSVAVGEQDDAVALLYQVLNQPILTFGPSLITDKNPQSSAIPFSLHGEPYSLGLHCRKENAAFYRNKLLPMLRETFRAAFMPID